MSRIGKAPIVIPEGVAVDIKKNNVKIKGPKGELVEKVDPSIKVSLENGAVTLTRPTDNRQHRAFHGLYRSLLANMVEGVTQGFSKKLQIVGVGYRAEEKGNSVIFHLGYSHPIVLVAPEGVEIQVENANEVIVTGMRKDLVGMIAAKIRSFRPPEPYKGKGVRYHDERVRHKAGKSAA